MHIFKFSKDEWKKYSDDAHLVVFNETDRSKVEVIDFALLAFSSSGDLLSYATLREVDSETIYMNHGGSFPTARGTILSYRSYENIINFLLEKYKYILTYIENTNTPMLKFAMKFGFRIVGIKNIDNKIYLEHYFRR